MSIESIICLNFHCELGSRLAAPEKSEIRPARKRFTKPMAIDEPEVFYAFELLDMSEARFKSIRIAYELKKTQFILWKDHTSVARKILLACISLLVMVGVFVLLLM